MGIDASESNESDADDWSDEESEGDSSCESDANEDRPPERLAFVVMTCIISGYTLIGPLQHNLKSALKVSDTGNVSEMFTQSVALVQWGKTVMTIGQNFLLAPFSPITRVYIAMSVMFVGTLIPPLFVFTFGSLWIGWVPLAYGMIGLALGVFEGTFLSVITPLGPLTKSWAIMGFPASFFIVNVFLGIIRAVMDVPVALSFWYVTIAVAVGIPAFMHIAPYETKHDGKSYKQAGLRASISDWQSWLIKLLPFAFVNVFSHFTMESVLPAVFNTYNAHQVSLLGPTNTKYLMKTSWFLVIFCVTMGIGDMISRRIGYCFDFKRAREFYVGLLFALTCSITGLWLTTKGIASVVWFSAFLAFFGNGFNYAITSRYIDKFIPRKHNLAAYSVWMFVGYCGAIAGATLVTMVRGWICEGHEYTYQCLSHHSHASIPGNTTINSTIAA